MLTQVPMWSENDMLQQIFNLHTKCFTSVLLVLPFSTNASWSCITFVTGADFYFISTIYATQYKTVCNAASNNAYMVVTKPKHFSRYEVIKM